MIRINEVQVKSILMKSGLPGTDYVVNPYNGCSFACIYCYAAQIARWKHPNEEWGTYLDVKLNAPELLKKELKNKKMGSIFFSSVTDPYVGMEAKYKLSRKCLEILAEYGYENNVSIQTKSPLVTRDIDVLQKLKDATVGFTVTTLDDKVSRFLETKAPSMGLRLEALKKLSEAGIKTYAFVGPLLPHFVNNTRKINDILDGLQEVGVKEVWFEHLNLNGPIKARMYEYLKQEAPELITDFDQADTQEYRDKLEVIIRKALEGRGVKLGLGKVIHHGSLTRKKRL